MPSPAHSARSAATPVEFLQASCELSAHEEDSTHAFLAVVNPWRATRGYEPLSWASAVKFLMARKFHVDRALQLYQQHELMRIREGLTVFDANSSPLKDELSAGKFTILPSKDSNGATLALFHAHKHDPSTTSHRTTLQGVVYQLDVALEEVSTQRGGLVFIYNMSGSKYSNFDYDLSQKILTLLKGAYPARLKKVLIVTAPLWFRAPFKVLRLFVREKLRDRVFTVSIPQLQLHVPPEALPTDMGGKLEVMHEAWLDKCAQVANNKDGELITMSSSQPSTPAEHKKKRHPTLEQLETLPTRTPHEEDNKGTKRLTPNGLTKLVIDPTSLVENPVEEAAAINGKNGHEQTSNSSDEEPAGANLLPSGEESGMPLTEFIEHVRVKGRRGLYEEYQEIKNRPPMGTFNHSRAFENQAKNRYTDVLCYDHTRVTLESSGLTDEQLAENGEIGDYINANFVDGYKQPKAFISSQVSFG